ncbi:MAG: hypothetical protein J0H42_09525 [Rhizobiales bacterium]|nr:hypothetical protein [Hyphomicrobiales bacterium]
MAHLTASSDYRFGRTHDRRVGVRARRGLGRVNGFLKSLIEAIADSKMRRIERELELRGYRYDRSSHHWMPYDSGPADTRKV